MGLPSQGSGETAGRRGGAEGGEGIFCCGPRGGAGVLSQSRGEEESSSRRSAARREKGEGEGEGASATAAARRGERGLSREAGRRSGASIPAEGRGFCC